MTQVRFGEFALDTDTRELLRSGRTVHLSPKAYQLLTLLVEGRPKALSKSDLQRRLWPGTFVVEANVANLVGEIRDALGDDPRRPRYLRTVHGFGYAFQGAAAEGGPAAASGTVCRLIWKGGHATLSEGEHILGRDAEASIVLDSPSISAPPRPDPRRGKPGDTRGPGEQERHLPQRPKGGGAAAPGGRRQVPRRVRGADVPDPSFGRQHADGQLPGSGGPLKEP